MTLTGEAFGAVKKERERPMNIHILWYRVGLHLMNGKSTEKENEDGEIVGI